MDNNLIKLFTARIRIATILKNRRLELKLTQEELAKRTGFKQAAIARIEAGKYFLNTQKLLILCRELNLQLQLIEREIT